MFRSFRLLGAPSDAVLAAFRVLGLDPRNAQHATSECVRSQYLKLARLHHPDLSSGDDTKMKIVNTAYELLQGSGVLHPNAASQAAETSKTTSPNEHKKSTRFAQKTLRHRRRVPDDFAMGGGDTWAMKSAMEWDAMLRATLAPNGLEEAEMRNPANHPFSHSKFFSFEDDTVIYRMIRGGASIRQVARTIGMPATFVERRLQNAQFKQRIQYVLRHEKREASHNHSEGSKNGAIKSKGVNRSSLNHSNPVGGVSAGFHETIRSRRKKEWESTVPELELPTFFADMTLEEKGRHAHILPDKSHTNRGGGGEEEMIGGNVASKVGRSYANYARLSGRRKSVKSSERK